MNIRMRELRGIRAVAGEPSADDIALIAGEEYAGAPVSPGDVHVRDVLLCHNQHDYTFERFPKAYLDRFAETIPGKSVLPGHDTGELPIGRWFRGRLQQRVEHEFPLAPSFEPGQAKVTWLKAGFYFPDDAGTELFRKNLDTGVYRWVSIGFRYDDLVCDVCSKSYLGGDCPHIIGRPAGADDDRVVMATYGGDPKKAQALEGSLVFFGAQQRARVTRAIESGHVDPKTLSMTAWGEDLVAQKSFEALAREGAYQSNYSPVYAGGEAESIDPADDPSFGGIDETAAFAAEEGGESPMTEHEKAALEAAQKMASDAQAALNALTLEADALRVDLMEQSPVVAAGEQALADLRAEILDNDLRATGTENPELAEIVELHINRANYARLRELAAVKAAAVVNAIPAGVSGDVSLTEEPAAPSAPKQREYQLV